MNLVGCTCVPKHGASNAFVVFKMTFQEADVLLTICMKCNVDDVKSAVAYLDGPKDPSWEEVAEFINELPTWSQLCVYWHDHQKKYSEEELRKLTKQYSKVGIIALEKIINQVDISG